MEGGETVVKVPQLAWSGDIDAELTFPGSWQVNVAQMKGYDAPMLSDEGFRKAFANPIGTKPIRELARGKKNVVIVFDDMARPTKVSQIVPYVLEELAAGGVDDDNIQFICAVGTHGLHTALDFRMKLGDDVVAHFNVYNHNCYENCTYIGKTSRGTPVSLNSEFVMADLKIAIGSLIPHWMVGYGGGGKPVLPGISSIETIHHNHSVVAEQVGTTLKPGEVLTGTCGNNPIREDIEEACRMSVLDVEIDAVVNLKRDTTALFVGEPIAQFYEGISQVAEEHYRTPLIEGSDIVVLNCYAKINEASLSTKMPGALLPETGGTLVVVTNNPWGEVNHYLVRRWGNHTAGRLWKQASLLPGIKKYILLMPYPDRAGMEWLAPMEAINLTRTWGETLAILKADYGTRATVTVVPDITVQYFEK